MAAPNATPSRLAIVTGAASGLGRAFCRQLAQQSRGWHIIAVDLDAHGAGETLDECHRLGNAPGEVVEMDVSDAAAWQQLRDQLQGARLRLDLLVNNAGICLAAEVGDGDLAAWRRLTEVNYFGVLNGCHTMTPWLKASAAGTSPSNRTPAVINVASVAGYLPLPAMGAYCASKAAVLALSEAMHAELRRHGVHVTVVAPGFFRTGLLDRGEFATRRHRAQAERLTQRATFTADDVARTALRAADRGALHVILGRRARMFCRWRRLAPLSLRRLIERGYRKTFDRPAGS